MELILVIWLIRRFLLGKWPFEMVKWKQPAPRPTERKLTIVK